MTFILSVSLVAVAALLIYHFILVPLFFSPLSTVPNAHFTSAWTSAWIQWKRRIGYETRSIWAAHQRCGPIVRLGPNEVSVASLDGLRQVYTGGFPKDEWYAFFANFGVPNMVSMLDFKSHSAQKKTVTNVYSKSYLLHSADLNTATSVVVFQRMVPYIRDKVNKGEPINVFEFSKGLGVDFTTAYEFGISLATNLIQDEDRRKEYIKNSTVNLKQLPGHVEARKYLEDCCIEACRAALTLDEDITEQDVTSLRASRPVVFSKIYKELSRSKRAAPEEILRQAASEMLDHSFAGLETTGITLTYLMYELSRRPQLQSSLREEILSLKHSFVEKDAGKNPGDDIIGRPQEVDSLPLLNAVLQETLRLYPAVPSPQPRIVPANGAIVEGHKLPGGVKISSAAYCLHRNEDVFPDPLAFKPERWLVGDKQSNGTDQMRRWFWAFGSGGRMCIGNNLAIYMIKMVTAGIYASFQTTIVDDEGIQQLDNYIGGPEGGKLILAFQPVSVGEKE